MNVPVECDVCIVGTGAGGGILAYELAVAGLNVVSLEQGAELPGDQFTRVMPPDHGENLGVGPMTVWPSDPHDSLFVHPLFAGAAEGSTARQSGKFQHFQVLAVNGLQNLWNGVSVRFSPSDLANWPISYSALAPHYDAVEELITVCGTTEHLADLPDGRFVPPKPLRPADNLIVEAVRALGDPDAHAIPNRKAINTQAGTPNACASTGICTSGCPVGAVYKFSTRLLPAIADRPNYTLRSHAKAVRVVRGPEGDRVQAVEYVDTQTGARHFLKARYVVVAAGAIETPRILFNSADDGHPHGLANVNDQLGRRLQDNPKVVLSTSLRNLWGRSRDYDVGYGDLLILLARGQLADGSRFPFIGHAIHGIPTTPHYLAAMSYLPGGIKARLARTMFYSYVTLGLFCAGDARPDNRVRLGATRDRWGVPQVEIDFAISQQTHHQMDAMIDWGRKVLKHASGTRYHITRDNSGTGIHYAGTTAMSANPEQGVVNSDLRAHSFSNLYICDGGVIPELPDKHLTLTIMALGHRLAGHLVKEFRHATQHGNVVA